MVLRNSTKEKFILKIYWLWGIIVCALYDNNINELINNTSFIKLFNINNLQRANITIKFTNTYKLWNTISVQKSKGKYTFII